MDPTDDSPYTENTQERTTVFPIFPIASATFWIVHVKRSGAYATLAYSSGWRCSRINATKSDVMAEVVVAFGVVWRNTFHGSDVVQIAIPTPTQEGPRSMVSNSIGGDPRGICQNPPSLSLCRTCRVRSTILVSPRRHAVLPTIRERTFALQSFHGKKYCFYLQENGSPKDAVGKWAADHVDF
jgi:hypothetical protein